MEYFSDVVTFSRPAFSGGICINTNKQLLLAILWLILAHTTAIASRLTQFLQERKWTFICSRKNMLFNVCHEYLCKNKMVGWNLRTAVHCVKGICWGCTSIIFQLCVVFMTFKTTGCSMIKLSYNLQVSRVGTRTTMWIFLDHRWRGKCKHSRSKWSTSFQMRPLFKRCLMLDQQTRSSLIKLWFHWYLNKLLLCLLLLLVVFWKALSDETQKVRSAIDAQGD